MARPGIEPGPLTYESGALPTVLRTPARSLGLVRKGKTLTIAKFYRTNIVIFSHSREGRTLSYSQINMVLTLLKGLKNKFAL